MIHRMRRWRPLINRLTVATIMSGVLLGQPPRAYCGEDDLLTPYQRRQKSAVRGNLARPEFDALRKLDRAETFAVEWSTPAKAYIEASDRTPVSADLAQAIARLLLKQGSLEPSTSLCVFQPAIGIRFHQASESDWLPKEVIDVHVCFLCRELVFQTVGEHYGPFVLNKGFIYSFEAVGGRLLELSRKARPFDDRLAQVQSKWDAEAERSRQFEERKREKK